MFFNLSSQEYMHIHRINTGSNVYLLEGKEKLVLIDAGYPCSEKKILSEIEKLAPKKLSLIFITHAHFDHYGSANAIRQKTDALIGIHQKDSIAMSNAKTPIPLKKSWGIPGGYILPLAELLWKIEPTRADIFFKDGDSLNSFGINGVAIHTPGHTNGSMSLLIDDSLLFVSDLIVTHPVIRRQCYYAENWEDIDISIKKIKKIAPVSTYPGHGSAVISIEKLSKL